MADGILNASDISDVMKDELGKFGATMAEERAKTLAKIAELDAEVKALKSTGTEGAFRDRYFAALAAGAPVEVDAREDIEVIIGRGRAGEGVQRATVNGHAFPVLRSMPRGLAGQNDGRGLLATRSIRAMALAVANGKSWDHDDAIDVASRMWGKKDPVLGVLEATRDLLKDLAGTDEGKREAATRALGTAVLGSGGGLVHPEYSATLLDFAHPMSVVRNLGAVSLPLNSNTLEMAYFDSAVSVGYQGENAGPRESSPAEGRLRFVRKILAGIIAISNELLGESSWAVDVFLRLHLARALAAYADKKFILGRGTEHEPRGLDWWAEQPTTAHYFNRTLAGGAVTFKTIMKDLTTCMERVTDEDLEIDNGRPGFIVPNREKYGLLRVTDAQDRLPFKDEVRGGTLLGAGLGASTQLPKTQAGDGAGSGTNNKARIYFADFSTFAIAEAEAITIEAYKGGAYKDSAGNVVSGITNRETVIAAEQKHDTGCLWRGKETARIDSVDWGVAF